MSIRGALVLFASILLVVLVLSGCGTVGPDYWIPTFAAVGGNAGETLSGSFVIINGGKTAGGSEITWKVFYSTDKKRNSEDVLVKKGTAEAVAAGTVSDEIKFSGPAPTAPGTYYLITTIAAEDDTDTSNNTGVSNQVAVSVVPFVDYEVMPFFVTGGNTDGALEFTFNIINRGMAEGTAAVIWTAYLSTDTSYDELDTIISSGAISALEAGGASENIAVSGTFPSVTGDYYVIILGEAPDDEDTSHNQ
jgi:hypothetical protein